MEVAVRSLHTSKDCVEALVPTSAQHLLSPPEEPLSSTHSLITTYLHPTLLLPPLWFVFIAFRSFVFMSTATSPNCFHLRLSVTHNTFSFSYSFHPSTHDTCLFPPPAFFSSPKTVCSLCFGIRSPLSSSSGGPLCCRLHPWL